jgi:hypothetical protein
MAIILYGMPCDCSICGHEINQHLLDEEEFVATTHFVDDEKNPLWTFSDSVMHRECFLAWPLRLQFIEAYNEAMRDLIDRHGTHTHMQENGDVVQLDQQGHIFIPDADEERFLDELIASFPSQQPPKSLPHHIETQLKKGKDLASRVFCERDGWHAWVWVHPVMKSGQTWKQVQEERSRTRQAIPYDDTIALYQVRLVELSDWHLTDEWLLDLDIAIQERPIVDENWEAPDVESLIKILFGLSVNFSRLRVPAAVDYPEPPLTRNGRLDD